MKARILTVPILWLAAGMGAAQAQDCSDITGKVCVLSGFEPNPEVNPGQANSTPNCSSPATPSQKDTVQAAFDIAPVSVKNELCKLYQIFIVTDHESWGRWEDPANHGGATPAKTEIAINTDDLARTFSKKQDDNLKVVPARKTNGKHDEVLSGRVDPKTFGLFYVIAHEIGHVKWHRDLPADGADCSDRSFYSWQDFSATKPRRWTIFGKNDDKETHKHSVKKPKDVASDADLESIYTGGFVTALAAASPEEDFVETYAVRALMDVCPTCIFNLKIGNNVIRINDDGGNPDLKAKFNCLYTKYIKTGGP